MADKLQKRKLFTPIEKFGTEIYLDIEGLEQISTDCLGTAEHFGKVYSL